MGTLVRGRFGRWGQWLVTFQVSLTLSLSLARARALSLCLSLYLTNAGSMVRQASNNTTIQQYNKNNTVRYNTVRYTSPKPCFKP